MILGPKNVNDAHSNSEIHVALAKSLEIIVHVTNCFKRSINLVLVLLRFEIG